MYYVGAIQCNPNYLEHHGILGMKWGVRRYQNQDGSLTPEGEQRYGVGEGDSKSNDYDHSKSDKANDYDHSKSDKSNSVGRAIMNGVGLVTSIASVPLLSAVGRPDLVAAAAMTAAASGGMLISDIVGVANASSRKKKVEKELEESPIDKKTGLHLKGDKNYTEDEDIKMVNPEFRNFDENTKQNCMLCTMTYDMRQRGYNVTANKASFGYNDQDMSRWYKNVKIESLSDDHVDTKTMTPDKGKAFSQKAISKIEAQGPNTRGNIMVKWMNGGGHSMVYKTDSNGKMMIIDCQSGKKYNTPREIEEILSHAYSGNFCRLDNLEFNKDTIKEVCR